MRRVRLVLVVLALAALVAACGGETNPAAPVGSSSPSPRPSSTGKLELLFPKPGDKVKGSTVKVRMSLTGARIVPATTKALKPDEGHLHILLDGQTITMTAALTTDLKDVPPGAHTLRIEFVAGDHIPFYPRVFKETAFEVTA
jgi:hypothetical protein